MPAFDKITNIIAKVEFAEDQAADLLREMSNYAIKYHRSWTSLMRIPAFRKLWEAIEEAGIYSLGSLDVPEFIVKRHALEQFISEASK